MCIAGDIRPEVMAVGCKVQSVAKVRAEAGETCNKIEWQLALRGRHDLQSPS
jgi:hypothetical protein